MEPVRLHTEAKFSVSIRADAPCTFPIEPYLCSITSPCCLPDLRREDIRFCLAASYRPFPQRFHAHHLSSLPPRPNFSDIPQYGGSGRDHRRKVSPSRFDDFAFLTRACPHSREGESDGTGEEPAPSQRKSAKRKRYVCVVNHPPIEWLTFWILDPRNTGPITRATPTRTAHRGVFRDHISDTFSS